jgi:hypothetical protein
MSNQFREPLDDGSQSPCETPAQDLAAHQALRGSNRGPAGHNDSFISGRKFTAQKTIDGGSPA